MVSPAVFVRTTIPRAAAQTTAGRLMMRMMMRRRPISFGSRRSTGHALWAMAGSRGERALMVCLARQAAFSEMMPLITHPVAKHGLALRVRTLCRGALRLGSTLHVRLCRRLLWHREESVRNHIARLIWYEGPNVWRSGGREASERTDPGAQPLAGNFAHRARQPQ